MEEADSPAGAAEAVAVGGGSYLLSLYVTGLDHVLLVRAVWSTSDGCSEIRPRLYSSGPFS